MAISAVRIALISSFGMAVSEHSVFLGLTRPVAFLWTEPSTYPQDIPVLAFPIGKYFIFSADEIRALSVAGVNGWGMSAALFMAVYINPTRLAFARLA